MLIPLDGTISNGAAELGVEIFAASLLVWLIVRHRLLSPRPKQGALPLGIRGGFPWTVFRSGFWNDGSLERRGLVRNVIASFFTIGLVYLLSDLVF